MGWGKGILPRVRDEAGGQNLEAPPVGLRVEPGEERVKPRLHHLQD